MKIKLSTLTPQLREEINNSRLLRNEIFQRDDGSRDRLWAVLDALEDAQLAIVYFNQCSQISCLELCGLLQAFVVQQDSIDLIRQTVASASQNSGKINNGKFSRL